MKRFIALLPLLALLTSCGAEGPELAALGWEEDWTIVGDVLAAEPLEGFTPEVLLADFLSGLHYNDKEGR